MFGEKVRFLRSETCLTQIDAAKKCNLPWRTYQDIESGKKPSYDSLIKVADGFAVSADWLMGRTEDRRLHQLEDDAP